MSSMFRSYRYSDKPLTIITELIAILLIFNKLKFNFALNNYLVNSKRQLEKITILFIGID